MGLFSSKTKINVYANTYQLMKSNPNALKDSLLLSVLSGDSIANGILNTAVSGMALRMDRMRAYAKTEYTLGLSTGYHSGTIVMDDEDLALIVAEDISAPYGVVVVNNYIAPLDLHHIILPYLLNVRGWNTTLNVISNFPVGITFPNYPWLSHKVSVEDVELSTDALTANIVYRINSYDIFYDEYGLPTTQTYLAFTSTFIETYVLPTGFRIGHNYCIAIYQKLDSAGTPETTQHHWFYAIESQKYPEIAVTNNVNEENNSMPVIPLRYNNADLTSLAYQETALYKTSKKLLKKLNLDIDTIAEHLNTQDGVAEIDHAYLMFGADLQSTNNEIIAYLTEFFDHLADISAVSMFGSMGQIINSSKLSQNMFVFNGQSATAIPGSNSYSMIGYNGETITATIVNNTTVSTMVEYGLNTSIVYSYCKSDIIAGSIGPIGTATMQKIRGIGTDNAFDQYGNLYTVDGSSLILKLQVANNAYKQVVVKGLVHTNNIYGGYNVVTTLTNVIDSADEHNFIIPIHYGVAKKLPLLQRHLLYEESFILVLNSYVITKVKWYQTGFFKFLVTVVTFAVALYFAQPWLLELTAAIEAGFVATVMFLLPDVLIGLLITTAFTFIADAIGPEKLMILAAIVAVVTIAVNPSGSFKLFGKTLPTAETFLSLSNAMMTGAQKGFEKQLEDVFEEKQSFEVESEARIKKLEAAQDLIEDPSDLVTGLLDQQINAFAFHPESGNPQNFFNMTIHIGNIGTLALEVIPNYHDIMLSLPEANNLTASNINNAVY